jgi:predicted molibdopterin-dependent oxidoreductase YjgC
MVAFHSHAQATSAMNAPVTVRINGQSIAVASDTIVAAAIAQAGAARFRRSTLNQPRGPLCGMGICMECRVTIDGRPHVRSCVTLCAEGMEVQTND